MMVTWCIVAFACVGPSNCFPVVTKLATLDIVYFYDIVT